MSEGWSKERRMKNWNDELQALVVEKLDMGKSVDDALISRAIDDVLVQQKRAMYLPLARRFQYKKELFDSLRRLDVLSEVSDDPEVTEIMVNGPDHIFIEKGGKLEKFERGFSSRKKAGRCGAADGSRCQPQSQ